MEYEIKMVRGGAGAYAEFIFKAERVDVKYNREPFEYKRREARRVNDRGFIATVFVITGWYKGESELDAANFQAKIRDLMKIWYRASDLHYLVWSCGDGTTKIGGKDAWRVSIKSGDAVQIADYPDTVNWVITLMEAT